MTRDTAEKVALGVLTSILTAIAVPFVLNAMAPKVTRAEFDSHLRESAAQLDSVTREVRSVETITERVLDVICTDKPQHRSCNAASLSN